MCSRSQECKNVRAKCLALTSIDSALSRILYVLLQREIYGKQEDQQLEASYQNQMLRTMISATINK